MLTAKEFSEAYRVEDITVRQWIRKGKIKSAMKTDSGWLIPEFVDVEFRESPSGYFWERRLLDLPREYEILNSYCCLTIMKADNVNVYTITLYDHKDNTKNITMSKKEKDAFELMLISNIDVRTFDIAMTLINNGIFK